MDNVCKEYKIRNRSENIFKSLFFGKYDIISAVNDISLEIQEGEIVGFLGPNGAGKSTTIKMLCGILTPSKGSIKVLENDPFKKRRDNAYKISVVFGQKSQLWWDLPVRDTFELLKKIYKVTDEVYLENLNMFRDYLEIDSIWGQAVRQLSLGQRMKAELAASIIHNPKIMFLDEPTIGLDVVAKSQIRKFIKELNKKYNTTIILTSHDMNDIEELCERIIIIDKGTKVEDLSKNELINKYSSSTVIKCTVKNVIKDMPEIKGMNYEFSNDGLNINIVIEDDLITVGDVINIITQKSRIEKIEIQEKKVEDIIKDIYEKGRR